MAQSSKAQQHRRVSARLTQGQRQQWETTLAEMRAHYAPVLAEWKQLSSERRDAFLDHAPVLAELRALAAEFD